MCARARARVYDRVCGYVCVCARARACAYDRVCVCARAHTHTHTCVRVYVRVCRYAFCPMTAIIILGSSRNLRRERWRWYCHPPSGTLISITYLRSGEISPTAPGKKPARRTAPGKEAARRIAPGLKAARRTAPGVQAARRIMAGMKASQPRDGQRQVWKPPSCRAGAPQAWPPHTCLLTLSH